MTSSKIQVPRSGWLATSFMLASLMLVIGILYWAREILIPIALAILLTFILAPIETLLRRRGLRRTFSVSLTVILTFLLLAAVGTMMAVELRALANELPKYRENIRKKVTDIRLAGRGGSIQKVQETVKVVMEEIQRGDAETTNAPPAVPVVVTESRVAETSRFATFGPLLEPLASAGLVIVLVVFMLLRREDLRDRLLRLAGYGRLAATTKALDEAGKRVSSYLLRQCLLNAGFGIGIGTGLFFIGLPYALLWGFLAGVARFIPYVGPWLGALAPIALSLAVFDSWTAPLMVIGLAIGLELVTNLLIEPLLYGQSIGVSEVALIVMIAFWTWLWGPIGLVLAAPLTVCLMVASKSVPDLEFLAFLLSSEPALDPHHVFYQRLVAKDTDEARDITEAYLREHSRPELFEQLFLPTLVACRRDFDRERITEEDRNFVHGAIRQMLDEPEAPAAVGEAVTTASSSPAARGVAVPVTSPDGEPREVRPPQVPLVIGCPAHDEADELALLMLAELLRTDACPMRVLPFDPTERREIALDRAGTDAEDPALVCICLLAQGPIYSLRQWCRTARAHHPSSLLVVARWNALERDRSEQQLGSLVDALGWRVLETKRQVLNLLRSRGALAPASGRQTITARAGTPLVGAAVSGADAR